MKYVVFFAVFLLSAHLSLQFIKTVNCPPGRLPRNIDRNSCASFTCDGPNITGVGCPPMRCVEGLTPTLISGNASLEYPYCCDEVRCAYRTYLHNSDV